MRFYGCCMIWASLEGYLGAISDSVQKGKTIPFLEDKSWLSFMLNIILRLKKILLISKMAFGANNNIKTFS